MQSRYRKMRMEQMEARELMAVTSASNLNATAASSSPTGDVAAFVQNGSLFVTEASGQLNKDNGIRATQLSSGMIRVEGTEGNNSAAAKSKVNGQAYQDFNVSSGLFVTLAGGSDRVQLESIAGGVAPTFNELRIDTSAPETGGSTNAKTTVADDDQVFIKSASTRAIANIATGRGNDWINIGTATFGDGVGNDDLVINSGSGADSVDIKGTQVRRNLEIQTYTALTENDADNVFFDTKDGQRPLIEGNINVRTGGGNDNLFSTSPTFPHEVVNWLGVEAKGAMTVDLGAGNDNAQMRNVRVGGNFTLNSGAGADSLSFHQNKIDGEFGVPHAVGGDMKIQTFAAALENDVDSLTIDNMGVKLGVSISMGGGNDSLKLAKLPVRSLSIDTGAGNDRAELETVHPKDSFFAEFGDGNDTVWLLEFFEPLGPSKLGGGNGTDRLYTESGVIATTVRTGWEYINDVSQNPGNDPGLKKAKKK